MTARRTRLTARERVGLAVVLAATFMGQVDGFVVTIAAPSVQRDLSASFAEVQLVGAAYVLAAAAGLITGGRLGDRFGRRRVFLLGVAGFTLASLACGLAPNPELLIAARAVQGAAAALLIPQELALLRASFPDEGKRARAISVYGVTLGLGVITGLAGGGFLVHADVAGLGWRTVFLINVPIGLLIVLLGRLAVAESSSDAPTSADLVGAVLIAVVLPALLVPIIFGAEPGALRWIWAPVLMAFAALVALIRQQRRCTGESAFPARLFTIRGVPSGLVVLATFFAGNAGLLLVFTYYVQTGLGHDPLTTSLMLTPLGIGFALGSAAAERLRQHADRWMTTNGCVALAMVLSWQLVVVQAPVEVQTWSLAVAIGAAGLAQGFVATPLIGQLFDQVPANDAGALSGVAATITQVGLAAGYATVGACYRLALGGTPGAGVFSPLRQTQAYTAALVVLVALALVTAAVCGRRTRSLS